MAINRDNGVALRAHWWRLGSWRLIDEALGLAIFPFFRSVILEPNLDIFINNNSYSLKNKFIVSHVGDILFSAIKGWNSWDFLYFALIDPYLARSRVLKCKIRVDGLLLNSIFLSISDKKSSYDVNWTQAFRLNIWR